MGKFQYLLPGGMAGSVASQRTVELKLLGAFTPPANAIAWAKVLAVL
jgi:hypothetical protein